MDRGFVFGLVKFYMENFGPCDVKVLVILFHFKFNQFWLLEGHFGVKVFSVVENNKSHTLVWYCFLSAVNWI